MPGLKVEPVTEVDAEDEKPLSEEEEKILKCAGENEFITRNEIIDLLDVSPSTAARLIKKLVKKNLLAQSGKARNTKYTIVK